MYKISADVDSQTALMFLDAVDWIPSLFEGCSRAEEAQQETFIIRFNKHYAPLAEKSTFDGHPVVLIKALRENSKMGEPPEKPQTISKAEAKKLLYAMIDQWRKIFHLSDAEIKKYWHKMIKKNFIIK